MSRPEVLPLTSPSSARWLREAVDAGNAELVRAFALPPEVLEPEGTPPARPRRSRNSHGERREGPTA